MRISHAPWPSITSCQQTSQVSFPILSRRLFLVLVPLPLLLPDNDINDAVFFNDNDDDVFPDVPMAELAPKRTLRSSRSTDAKSSAAPVDDDVKKKKKRER